MACGPKGHAISIHALLAESDSVFDALAVSAHLISIHALLAESDTFVFGFSYFYIIKFLSTLSLRRATNAKRENRLEHCISIHALLAESDRPVGVFCIT